MIEFAFSIPVFLALIYYVHDLPKQKRMQRKMQFVANEIAMILQNTGAKRALTKNDLINAVQMAWLAICPGVTQRATGSGFGEMPLGYLPLVTICCVAGTGQNSAVIKWYRRIYSIGTQGYYYRAELLDTTINGSATEASSIHPKLRISQAGEIKIIVECSFYSDGGIRFSSSKLQTKDISKKQLFGFLFYSPKSPCRSRDKRSYFNAVTIFSPINNSLNEVAP